MRVFHGTIAEATINEQPAALQSDIGLRVADLNGWDYVAPGRRNPCGEATMWGDYHMREIALYVQRLAENGPYMAFFGP